MAAARWRGSAGRVRSPSGPPPARRAGPALYGCSFNETAIVGIIHFQVYNLTADFTVRSSHPARVAELADAVDSKSTALYRLVGSTPTPGTKTSFCGLHRNDGVSEVRRTTGESEAAAR